MRFGFFGSAVAIMIGAVCVAGSANAATLTEVADVSGTFDCGVAESNGEAGCLFSGNIDDTFYTGVVPKSGNSYLNAVFAYNSFVQSNPGEGLGPLEVSPIGETEYDTSLQTTPNYIAQNGEPYDLTQGFDPILDPSNTQIGQVDFCTPDGFSSVVPAICQSDNDGKDFQDGDWALTVNEPADYVAVDSQNHFIIYEIIPPSTSGSWTTFDISNDLGDSPAKLEGLVLFSAVPEPATWAMMLMGFGAIGAGMRLMRRREKLASV